MKKDQANKTNVERVYRWQPLAWEPGLNGSSIDLWLVWEWAQCSCTSCASMLQSWSRAEAEEAEWRQMGSEAARGGQRRGREVVPWQLLLTKKWHCWSFLDGPMLSQHSWCSWCSGAPRSLSKVCWWLSRHTMVLLQFSHNTDRFADTNRVMSFRLLSGLVCILIFCLTLLVQFAFRPDCALCI